MKKHYEVKITLKKSVLDPQGQVIQEALHSLGYQSVCDVRVGKSIDVAIESSGDEKKDTEALKAMCEKLLSNPVIEDYQIRAAS